ncbi:MAG TPA: polysaccharide deacetylase family protein [Polyangiales bacterium]|nr:polysaccharide deacetylase family protein [Polyangiales bacterium]
MSLLGSLKSAVLGRLRPIVRDLGAELLHRSTLTHPSRVAHDKLTIVTFHRVLPADLLAEYPIPAIAVTPDELDWFLQLFEQHYTVGTLAEVGTRFALGDRPERPLLAITFDDGQRDNYDFARPVLAQHGTHASFFIVADATEENQTLWHDRIAYGVAKLLRHERSAAEPLLRELGVTTDAASPQNDAVAQVKRMTPEARDAWVTKLEACLGGPSRPSWDGMMTWQQLREMHDEGHEIGSHSRSHAILPLVSDAQLEIEIAGSRKALRDKLGFEIQSFCYPNGDHDERSVRAVERAGYRHAVTTRYGINAEQSSPYTWRRLDMQGSHARTVTGDFSEARVLLRLTGRLPSAY